MATPGIQLRVKGIDQLVRSIKAWEGDKSREVARLVVSTAYEIERDAKKAAPVDTGRLRASITRQVGKNERFPSAVVGTNVKYAPFVEFGTGRAGAASDVETPDGYTHGSSTGVAARPFLFPAFESHYPGFVRELRRIINDEPR